MQRLIDRLKHEARYLGEDLVKVDGFLNHQVDTDLLTDAGRHLAKRFSRSGVSKIVTAEASGIVPAFATAQALKVPFIFARKKRPLTMAQDALQARVPSRTRGGMSELFLSREYLGHADRILVVDDFLGSGTTALALADMVRASGAVLVGFGFVIEKRNEEGRQHLAPFGVPVECLAEIALDGGKIQVF